MPSRRRGRRIVVAALRLGYLPRMVDGQGVRTSARVVVVATAVLVATAIGSTADAASGGSKRPEGPWTMVNWEVSRTPPSSDYVPGTASISLLAYSPRCASGPCALRVRPAGRNGTYNAAGEPVTKDADRSTHRFNWNGKDAVYTAHRDYGRVSCTTSDGAGGVKTVPDGFTQTSDATYRFRPARSRVPASMTGERVSTATGTPEGVPQGCTDISVTARVAGSPTGSVQVTARGASGHYRITETVERTEPATDRPRGFTGILVPDSTIAAKGRGLTLTGIVGTARLRPTRAGWTGSVKGTRPSCVSSSTAPGYDATETWTGIRPVARTETGAPILAGTWRYVANPTASGVADGCSLTTNRGFVILVPLGAIGP